MSERTFPVLALAGTLSAAALSGVAVQYGHPLLAVVLGGALTSLVGVLGCRLVRRLRADAEATRRLAALVDQRTAELEQRGRDLGTKATQLEAARTHLGVTDRLAAVGRLASGVAHEINNPLAVALTNLAWLREVLPGALRAGGPGEGPPAEELLAALAETEAAGQRVARIVRDLLDFAQERSHSPGASDLVPVLEHVQRLVGHEVRARARLVVELPAAPLLVGGSGARLGQLLAHLVLHAALCIEEGHADENEVRVVARADERGALVEVSDTGRGLAPEALAHVFDPFYEAWSGSRAEAGLGLALCHGLAGALGGDIAVESAPGRGSVYRVRLPLAASETRLALGGRRAGSRPRVLVVDDEPLVCASLYRVLSRSFDVVPHTSARHALSLIRAGEHFDAVLCDLMMPEMSGIAFHEELTQLRPALAEQVVFLTGGAFTPGARDFLERVPNPRLHKPFEPAEVVAVLDGCCKDGAATPGRARRGQEPGEETATAPQARSKGAPPHPP